MIHINLIVMPFSELIENLDDKVVHEMLNNFDCERETFIENFVKKKIYQSEKMASSKSYFIIDQDRSDSNHLCALGYYALSLKVMCIKKEISCKDVKKLHLRDKQDTHIPAYYIALLAKNDNYKDEIKGKEIIDCAINTILEAVKCVGGRVIWVEAKKENEGVVQFYINHGFKEFQTEIQNDGIYSHLLKVVKC